MRVFLTLDNVLTDFQRAAAILKEAHPEINTRAMFWEYANKYPTFWSAMVSNPVGLTLFKTVEHLDPIILTSIPDLSVNAYDGKREWVDNNLGDDIPMFAGLQGFKHILCDVGDVLYDDNTSNLTLWSEMGGIGIKVNANGQ